MESIRKGAYKTGEKNIDWAMYKRHARPRNQAGWPAKGTTRPSLIIATLIVVSLFFYLLGLRELVLSTFIGMEDVDKLVHLYSEQLSEIEKSYRISTQPKFEGSVSIDDLTEPRWFDWNTTHGIASNNSSQTEAGSIPLIIHQTWKTSKLNELPPFFRENHEKWKEMHPQWQIKLWSDEDMDTLVRDQYPEWYPHFKRFPIPVQRADLFRYLVLYSYGGVYVDMDVEPLQPLDSLISLLQSPKCILGQEPFEHAAILENRLHFVCNAFLASEPKHKLWKVLLEQIMKRIVEGKAEWRDPVSLTGPRALTKVVEWKARLTDDCKILIPEVFYPSFDSSARLPEECLRIVRRAYWKGERVSWLHMIACRLVMDSKAKPRKYPLTSWAVHHWTHTWLSKHKGKFESHA